MLYRRFSTSSLRRPSPRQHSSDAHPLFVTLYKNSQSGANRRNFGFLFEATSLFLFATRRWHSSRVRHFKRPDIDSRFFVHSRYNYHTCRIRKSHRYTCHFFRKENWKKNPYLQSGNYTLLTTLLH